MKPKVSKGRPESPLVAPAGAKPPASPADLACERARKVCTRILGELDAWLAGETHHTQEVGNADER